MKESLVRSAGFGTKKRERRRRYPYYRTSPKHYHARIVKSILEMAHMAFPLFKYLKLSSPPLYNALLSHRSNRMCTFFPSLMPTFTAGKSKLFSPQPLRHENKYYKQPYYNLRFCVNPVVSHKVLAIHNICVHK